MPLPDYISSIGHGRLGLRDNLRQFADFIDESDSKKEIALELRPGVVVASWSVDTGSTYVATAAMSIDGLQRDVVAVRTLLDSGLTRAESLADCRATAGSYYFDPDEVFLSAFGWERSYWDIGVAGGSSSTVHYWDQFPKLYVHLSDGSDPSLTTVTASFGFYYAGRGMFQPCLGEAEKLTDGGFEAWSSSSDLTSWTEALSGAGNVVAQEATDVQAGTYALRFNTAGTAGSAAVSQAGIALVSGRTYRLYGRYKTSEGASGLVAEARVGNGSSAVIGPDGRTFQIGLSNPLAATAGNWRRFSFDFVAPVTSAKVELKITAASSASGYVLFDDLHLRRVFRFNYYEPRISAHDIPAAETGSNDIFFGGKRVGIGSVTLNNGDGLMDKLLGLLEWLNHDAIIFAGGSLIDGQELSWDDWRKQFSGLVQDYSCRDADATFELQDARVNFHSKLPPRIYDDITYPNLDQRFLGKSRPLFFGAKDNITPVRISFDGTYSKYGLYEIADTVDAPNGINAISAVYAYLDEQAATDKRQDLRLTLTVGTHYTADLANGQFTIAVDVGPYQVTTVNNKINFTIGGAELTATLTVGLYTAAGLASEAQTQLRSAVGGGDVTMSCAYSESTNKFTIAKSSGTLTLKTQSGANKDISGYPLLGFQKGADRTGSLSYAGDDVTFTAADKDHIIRVSAQGYKDTAGGKYTGTASALIQIGADICQVLVEKYLKKPYSIIDQTSFVFARQRAPESLTIYLKELTSTKNIFDRLEFSNVANIVLDGQGFVYYKVYVGEIPAGITDLYDYDYGPGFRIAKSITDVYPSIQVQYDQDPTSGEFVARQATDDSVRLRFGRSDQRAFESYIKNSDNAIALASRLLTLAQRPARKVTCEARGKLIDKEVGDKVRLTRRRALDPNGQLAGQVFRIIALRKSPADGRISADLVDDVVTVAGIQCVTACQALCETSDQSICVISCQETCQQLCQEGCQAATQGCGYTTCQTACQASCQGCGQTNCQASCQTGCQGSCQANCQSCGQGSNCQTSCETACQGCGQGGSCQTSCQKNCQSCGQAGHCQTSCETACQGCGQTSCQNACEHSCQTTCQLTCQSVCQADCQTSAEHLYF